MIEETYKYMYGTPLRGEHAMDVSLQRVDDDDDARGAVSAVRRPAITPTCGCESVMHMA